MINKKGVASIRIEYDQGDIKVFHGDDNILLASWKEPDDVNDHWDDLWEYLNYMVAKYKGYRMRVSVGQKINYENKYNETISNI